MISEADKREIAQALLEHGQDKNICRTTGHYDAPACRVYGLRLRSTLLNLSGGDIEDIGDDDEIPGN